MNQDGFCRICKLQEMPPILLSINSDMITAIPPIMQMNFVFGSSVHRLDGRVQTICEPCLIKLKECYNFKKTFLESEKPTEEYPVVNYQIQDEELDRGLVEECGKHENVSEKVVKLEHAEQIEKPIKQNVPKTKNIQKTAKKVLSVKSKDPIVQIISRTTNNSKAVTQRQAIKFERKYTEISSSSRELRRLAGTTLKKNKKPVEKQLTPEL